MATKNKIITSNTQIVTTTSALLPECSQGLVANIAVEMMDEDLVITTAGGTLYKTRFAPLLESPEVKVSKIDSLAVETPLYEGTDYTINHIAGEITLSVATSDVIRADYFYNPLPDDVLNNLMTTSLQEVSVLIHRPIDPEAIPVDYKQAICKRFYTNVLKALLIEARNYFSLSIAGRSVNKSEIPKNILLMIAENEKQLLQDLNQLRYFNQTNRLE